MTHVRLIAATSKPCPPMEMLDLRPLSGSDLLKSSTNTTPLEVLVSNITKADLLDSVANDAGVSKKDVESVLGAFFDFAIASAKKGDKVSWPGFGSFQGVQKKATTARNPRTGDTVKVPARKDLKFTKSSTMREALNGKKKK